MNGATGDPVLLPIPRRMSWSGRRVAAGTVVEARDDRRPAQSYRLAITDGRIDLTAADGAGAFYARATLDQLRQVSGDLLPEGEVDDAPDVAVRGVMLDVSRDKVPTVETLEVLIDRLARWKVNHVELYMEHTFAYRDHEEVWARSTPYTAADIARLDAFCRERHVELAPNQNCLGHFERWLRHDRYRALAVSPDGWTDGRGRRRPPTTMEPSDPRVIELVASLLEELAASFSSRRLHVGLDEPWELRDDRFGDYLDYVRRLRARPELDGRELLMWGDIVASHPEELASVPDGVTVCEWGYEADHPFAERAAVLAEAGRPFWLCPGTSSWNSVVGRTTNMVENCRSAAQAAIAMGAEGYLVTDWGDNGHLQYLPISEPGFAFAAAVAWCAAANRDMDLPQALSAHAFADGTGLLGRGLLALGDVHRLVTPQLRNTSVLVAHLLSPRYRIGEGTTAGVTVTELDAVAAAIADARDLVARSQPARADGDLVRREVDAGAALLDLLVRDARERLAAGGTVEAVSPATRARLAAELRQLVERHRALWSARNRHGGLDDSCARLEALAAVHAT